MYMGYFPLTSFVIFPRTLGVVYTITRLQTTLIFSKQKLDFMPIQHKFIILHWDLSSDPNANFFGLKKKKKENCHYAFSVALEEPLLELEVISLVLVIRIIT